VLVTTFEAAFGAVKNNFRHGCLADS